ncbi:SpoIIE family protein phosphatase [Tautonia plasticadhaerens]|uniref:Phosphoserine phosphatase RsbU n=1 Tax=Tautonia plasticadhaerens TaxID=2527974 RepID=A0A518GZZ4_9BACT|nr:SpoIIE family protein phosphatase [Tautonia plasticadhaerens]QDV34152.1 Phosphoserine phosphatase RsbU [Tautonia plasticadhaerens]
MRRISIRYIGPLLFVVPVIAVIVALQLVSEWEIRKSVDELAGRVVDQVTERVEQRLDGDLSIAVQLTRQAELMVEEGTLDPADLRSWRPAFHDMLVAFPMVDSLAFGTPDGRATWVIRYPGEAGLEFAIEDDQTSGEIVEYTLDGAGEPGERLGSYAFDTTSRPWYEAAVEAGGPTWSAIYPWVRRDGGISTLGIAYCRPVRDDGGELIGVLSADLALLGLSAFLRSVEVSETGQSFLVGPDGNLIAASADVAVARPEGGRVPASEADDPIIRAVDGRVSAQYGSFGQVDRHLGFRMPIDGERYRVEVEPLQNPWELDWRTVVVVPESEVTGALDAVRRRAWLIGGLVALSTLGLGIVASQAMVRPVLRLVEGVRAIGSGDLDHHVAVSGTKEFAQLSDELNRMAGDLKDRLKIRQSLALAMEIQQKLLPAEPPAITGLDIAGHSTYCDETGGDYYDFLELDETAQGDLIVVLGDVMGHGVAAALLMATARGILRSRAAETGSLGELLTHVNRQLEADTGGERFMTMILMVVDVRRGTIRWSSAGHDEPILYDPEADRFAELPEINGLPLGVMDDSTYGEASLDGLAPGRILLVGVGVSKVGGKSRTTGVADGIDGFHPQPRTDIPPCAPPIRA